MSEEWKKDLRSRLHEFPWIKERQELRKERSDRIARGEVEVTEYGGLVLEHYAPLKEILKYAEVARNQKEIWEVIKSLAEKPRAVSDAKFERGFLLTHIEWYRLKNHLPYSDAPFLCTTGVLINIAQGKFPDDLDSQEVKDFILRNGSVKK